MEVIQQIGLQVIEVLALGFGILGMAFSLMLIFSPNQTKNLSNILNRNINFDNQVDYLDKNIEITAFLYDHNVLMGLMFIAGSVFALFFFFFTLDITNFTGIFFGSLKHALVGEIIINSAIWVGKVGCLTGLLFGFVLVFEPDKMRLMESKLNSLFETKTVIDKLDQSSHDLDAFFFRHSMLVGLMGAVISFFLISLSIVNLLE